MILYEGTVQADSRIFTMMTKFEKEIAAIVGKPAVDQKITEACKATVQTAVEFESLDLLEEAQTKCKKYVPDAFTKFEIESNKSYALATKDVKMYVKATKELVGNKTMEESNRQQLLKKVIQEVLDVFYKETKVLKLAEQYASELVEGEDNYGNRYALANVQFHSGNFSDAKVNAITAMDQAKLKKVNTRQIEILLKKIEERS